MTPPLAASRLHNGAEWRFPARTRGFRHGLPGWFVNRVDQE